jgi:polyisoprenoid-binding protein YceI
MKRTLLLILTGLMLIAGNVFAADWVVDKAHSSMNFKVKHLVISTVSGTFTEFEGTFSFDPNDLSTLSGSVTAQIASINTGDEKRDGHLKTGDFFDAENHPTMQFQSTGVKVIGPGKIELSGNLTIRGVTKPATFDVEGLNQQVEFMGTTKVAGTATTTINRQDFGISWNSALDTGGMVVSDNVVINLELELNQK